MIYQAGETIRLVATITDIDDAAADPSTTNIVINLPSGTEAVASTAMTQAATGSYYYDYTIPSTVGKYAYSVTGTGGTGRVTITKGAFIVDAAI